MINGYMLTDSYKHTHKKMWPPKTETVFSYLESRGGLYPATIFFGLQMILKKYLCQPIFSREAFLEAEPILEAHFRNQPDLLQRADFAYLADTYGGKPPVKIYAVPEGSYVDTHNVLMTIENTDPRCFWLTNFLESLLLQVWYTTTVATRSFECKTIIREFLDKTGSPQDLEYKLHDFGFRACTCPEQAEIGGAAHLVNFKSTDTLCALLAAKKYYGEDCAGYSIPASEHSPMIAWGREHEAEAYTNAMDVFQTGAVSIVADSYDIHVACREIFGEQLHDKILERPGVLVIRPDSGVPEHVVLDVVRILDEKFGTETNSKGYKVLNPKVRVLQGDGIDPDKIRTILQRLESWKYSADNVAFGMGGKLLQDLQRDTQNFAIKTSQVVAGGNVRDVCKTPATAYGKNSKAGRFKLTRDEAGHYHTVSQNTTGVTELVEVYSNGELLKDYSFEEIRARAEKALVDLGR